MSIRCPNCGKHVYPDPDGCPNCGYPEEVTPREPFFRVHDNERDMELYDDLFDAHAKLAEQGGIDQP